MSVPNPTPPLRDRSAARSEADPTGQNTGHQCGAFSLSQHAGAPALNFVPAIDNDADDPGWEGQVSPAAGGRHASGRAGGGSPTSDLL
jgi:hypothetical protein